MTTLDNNTLLPQVIVDQISNSINIGDRLNGGLMAAFGDSLTANSFTNSIQSGGNLGNDTIGFITWAQAFSMGAIDCPTAATAGNPPTLIFKYNRGVGGEQAEQCLARIPELDRLPKKPKYANVCVGINNVRNNVNQSAKDVANVIVAICEQLISRDVTPILCQLLPHDGTTQPQNNSATISKARELEVNRLLNYYAGGNAKKIIYVPWYNAILDPASAVGDPLPAYVSDGLHHTTTGAAVLGQAWWNYVKAQISPFIPFNSVGSGDVYDATNNPNGTLVDSAWLTNGGTAGAGATATGGGIPSGWTWQRSTGALSTATVNLQARADGSFGKEVVVTTTGADAGSLIGFPGGSGLAVGNIPFGVPIRMRCEIEHTATGAIASLPAPPQVFWRVGTFLNFIQPLLCSDNLPIVGSNLKYIAQSHIIVLPVGSGTTNNFHLDVYAKAGGLVTTTKFSNVSLTKYDQTAPGSIPII